MPIYTFKCNKCNLEDEKVCNFEDSEGLMICSDFNCKGVATKLVSSTKGIVVNGKGSWKVEKKRR